MMPRFSARAAIVALAAAVAGCGSGEGVYRQSVGIGPEVEKAFVDLEDLEDGRRYVTRVFKPTMAVKLPGGKWKSRTGDSATGFSIEPDKTTHPVDAAYLAVSRITRVYDPQRGGNIPAQQVPFKGDIVPWLTGHAHLVTTPPQPVEMLGLKGVQFDVTARESPWKIPRECGSVGPNCVPLWHDGLDFTLYTSTSKGRFIVLDLPSRPQLVIEQYVRPRYAFEPGLARLKPLLDGLELER